MRKRLAFVSALYLASALAVGAQAIEFDAPEVLGNKFEFAIIGDLTGGERKGIFEQAAQAIAKKQPDFVLSVGDLIEGGTEDIQKMRQEWQAFLQRAKLLNVPFYPLVGNHDISNAAMRHWWLSEVGPRYYHFRVGGHLFLMLDSEDFSDKRFSEFKGIRNDAIAVYKSNPEAFKDTEYAQLPERKYGQLRDDQQQYFLKVLQQHKDAQWVFVFMHKPLYLSNGSGFKNIENELKKFSYTVFNGHEHAYFQEKRQGRDYIQLGTTGGAFTPKKRGEYMDHVIWVSIDEGKPKIQNITMQLLVNSE